MGFSYEHQGLYPEAVEAITKRMTLFGEPPECAAEVKEAFEKNGIKGFWQKRLEEIETRPHLKNFPTYSKAFVYVRLDDKEHTLESLSKAFEQRARFIVGLKYANDLDLLRDDPRFQDLISQMGL